MKHLDPDLPRIVLDRAQWMRLALAGILVAFVLGRSIPDLVRAVDPLQVFDYATDAGGVVVWAHARAAPPRSPGVPTLEPGDRLRIDGIPPFDRKPGLAGIGYTYDNPLRQLAVERSGRTLRLGLAAQPESGASRVLAVLRIVLFTATVSLGALLFLVRPGIATAAFFALCVAAEAPATFLDLATPNPWREILEWIGDTLHGAARPALLLFAITLIDRGAHPRRDRIAAATCALLALALGSLRAEARWQLTYAGHGAAGIDAGLTAADTVLVVLSVAAFIAAFARARDMERTRVGWIAGAFVVAAGAQLLAEVRASRIEPVWLTGVLVSTSILPAVAVWVAVVRERFFNVDFVVSRAIIYAALTAAALGALTLTEEVGTYVFYNNTNITYGAMILVSLAIGAFTGKLYPLVRALVDRFIFRDRLDARRALEYIAGYILDAETADDVFRALLADASHALGLTFGGFLARLPDGDYALSYHHDWPPDCIARLKASNDLAMTITRKRGAWTLTAKDRAMIARAFPDQRLTFAAPLYFNRSILGIVMYGQNVSGLELDPEEREHLVRAVAHASIALSSIELARCRGSADASVPAANVARAV